MISKLHIEVEKLHSNVDGLSRRPRKENFCNYCAKIEIKDTENRMKKLGRIVLREDNFTTWRDKQLVDPILSLFLMGKETETRPSWQEVIEKSPSARIYWNHWDALVLQNGVLYKKWKSPRLNKHILQIIVPTKKYSLIIGEAHDFPSGGHFGINRTLAKIRQKFY